MDGVSDCAGAGDDSPGNDGSSACYDPNDDDGGDGDEDEHIDFGLFPCQSLGGEVFYDDNADGCQEEGEEEGVPGIDVHLFECGTTDTSPGNAVASATTDNDGEYAFGPDESGDAEVCLDPSKEYFVVFDLPLSLIHI